jgi:hypothetical protein
MLKGCASKGGRARKSSPHESNGRSARNAPFGFPRAAIAQTFGSARGGRRLRIAGLPHFDTGEVRRCRNVTLAMPHCANFASMHCRIAALMKVVNDAMPNDSNTALAQDRMAGMPHRRIAAVPAYGDAGTP